MFVASLVLSASMLVWLSSPPAAACSCASADVAWFIENTDAGFIGTLEATEGARDGRGGLGGLGQVGEFGDDWNTVANRFAVEAWIHGDLEAGQIDVWAPDGGGACGLEIPVGRTAAVFIDRQGDRFTSSLCSTLDADVVRAALSPDPLPGGQARFAVPGVFLGGGMAMLDASGRLIGYDSRHRFEWNPQVHRCPGGERAVLIGNDRAVLVDLADLSVVETTELAGLQRSAEIRSVHCADEQGDAVQLVVQREQVLEVRRLDKIDSPGRVIELGAEAGSAVIAGEHIVVQTYLKPGERLLVVDPGAEPRTVGKLVPAGPDSYLGYGAIKARPGDGAVVAVLESEYSDRARGRLWLFDPADGQELVSREIGGEVVAMHWLGRDRLVVSVAGEGEGRTEVIDSATLDTVETIETFFYSEPVLYDEALWGTKGPAVSRAGFGGPVERVATLPSESIGPMLVLSEPMDVAADSGGSEVVLRPVDPNAAPLLTAAGESNDDGGFPWLPVVGGIAALVAAMGAVALSRRGGADVG